MSLSWLAKVVSGCKEMMHRVTLVQGCTSGLRIGRLLCVGVAIKSSRMGLVGFLAMK